MAKVSSIQKNLKRQKRATQSATKRDALKAKIYDKNISLAERFALVTKLAALPRNAAQTRVRNRCELTGRPRGYYRKFRLGRNMLRLLAGGGKIPGLVKSSW
jgi:small subunit ribosomal protein S14